jgi:hypothetical protein
MGTFKQPVQPTDHKAEPNSEDTNPSVFAGYTVKAIENGECNGPIGNDD